MGDSDAWEKFEGRDGPPTFKELFKAARRGDYRHEALNLIENLELEPAREIQVRRKLAETLRAHQWRRQFMGARPALERANRLILDAEQELTRSLKHFNPRLPPAEIVAARNTLRQLVGSERAWRGKPGAPPMPHVHKALVDLGLDKSDARTLLRGIGIHLSLGRPPRR